VLRLENTLQIGDAEPFLDEKKAQGNAAV